MWEDPIVAEVRRIREEYAARFNYDLEAIFRHLNELEQKIETKGVGSLPQPAGGEVKAASPAGAEQQPTAAASMSGTLTEH